MITEKQQLLAIWKGYLDADYTGKLQKWNGPQNLICKFRTLRLAVLSISNFTQKYCGDPEKTNKNVVMVLEIVALS